MTDSGRKNLKNQLIILQTIYYAQMKNPPDDQITEG